MVTGGKMSRWLTAITPRTAELLRSSSWPSGSGCIFAIMATAWPTSAVSPELERWIPQGELEHLDSGTLILAARLRHPMSRLAGRGGACTRSTDIPRSGIGRSGALVPSGARHGLARSRMVTSQHWSEGLKLTV